MEPWIGPEERKAVGAYLLSQGWLTEFRKTEEFEKMIRRYVGARYATVVTSGTAALAVALLSKGIGHGDEVIVPDYSMIASANAVLLAGAKPVFIDIDPKTLCLDFKRTKKAVGKKTRAIVLVTLNGRYPTIEEFVRLARKKNLFLLEDAAQSLGSRYKGKHLGTWGDAGIFSFSVPKIITTGQGGVIVTDSRVLHDRIRKIKDFGRIRSGVDEFETLGFNFKFTDLQAVIGIEQMKKLSLRVRRKKEIYARYRTLLKDIPEIEFIDTNLKNTSPWFIDILVPERKRDALMRFLGKRGIGTRPFYPAIHTQAPYRYLKKNFPVSQDISKRGLWLPSSSFLEDAHIRRISDTIRKFFK